MPYVSEEEKYSPLAHLASIICPWWLDPAEVIFVMLTFAFDAGGDEKTAMLTVAGFVSSAGDWQKLSELWTKRLQQDGVEFFRAVDLAFFRGPFQHWNDRPDREALRRSLSADLMNILKSHVYRKFGCTIVNKEWNKLSLELRKLYLLRAYSVAGRTCEQQGREWMASERSKAPAEFVFEAGDVGEKELQIRLATDSGTIPIFRPKKDTLREDGTTEYGFVPLQPSDWLAYELNKLAAQAEAAHAANQSLSVDDMRWPMQEFHRIHGEPGIYTDKDAERLEQMLKLSVNVNQWAKGIGL